MFGTQYWVGVELGLVSDERYGSIEMPPMKKIEPKEAAAGGCILRHGKMNNVVAWNEELKFSAPTVDLSSSF